MKNVVVYCGSSLGNSHEYVTAAKRLGEVLANKNLGLVYGGGCVGLMGILADTVMGNGGRVTGVIPQKLNVREIQNENVTELIEVETMHERKKIMSDRADGAIVLPGGFGTLDEMFEFVTWTQLGYHVKPIGLLNVNWYFSPLLNFLSIGVREGFIRQNDLDLLIVKEDPDSLIDEMNAWQPKFRTILNKVEVIP